MENQNQNVPTPPDQAENGDLGKRKKIIIIAAIAALIVILLGVAGYISYPIIKKKFLGVKEADTFDTKKILDSSLNIQQKFSFPEYQYQKSSVAPAVPDYSLNASDLGNLKDFEKAAGKAFSSSQKEALNRTNFFVSANLDNFYNSDPSASTSRVDDWTDLYDRIGGAGAPQERRPENSVFITSDFLLHVYHKLLEKEFEYIEQKEFYPRIKTISDEMLKASIDGYNSSTLEAKKNSYKRLITYFAVPSAVLEVASKTQSSFSQGETIIDDKSDTKEAVGVALEKIKSRLPADAYDLAKAEIDLVMAADKSAVSPLLGPYQKEQGLLFEEDYTQYGPRSHYSKNPILRSYFRSMMWYGRQNLLLKSPELTRDAINITLLMSQSANLGKLWEEIYVPTSFFVGESDDLSIYEYKAALEKSKDTGFGEQLIGNVQKELLSYKNPQIMSSLVFGDKVTDLSKEELQNTTKGFRFMGQRFTPDAFMFSTLTQGDEQPDPKTGESLPSSPTATMIMSVMGSSTATGYMNKWIEVNAPQSKNVLADRLEYLKKYLGDLNQDEWTQNIYWGWLHTLRSLFQENTNKSGYPNFVRNDDWNKKNLSCSLGSWTELKHDTLLYAKQAYSEMGGGGEFGETPPVPKGYVEPNIEFFDRIIPLTKMTQEGLRARSLLDDTFMYRGENFQKSLEFFRKIALAELGNQKISDEDFEKLRLEAGNLENVISPLPGEQQIEDGARASLIADVFTDGKQRQILYEAVGIPNYIYVGVKDANGTRLTKGLVYSQYEFKNPLEKRLTDVDWKEWIYSRDKEKTPPLSDWSREIIKE